MSSNNSEAVKVIVRCRPFSNSEKEKQSQSCLKIENGKQVTLLPSSSSNTSSSSSIGGDQNKQFTFDYAFDQDSLQVSPLPPSWLRLISDL